MRLDHATLRTSDLPGLRRFFEDVFDLRDGFRPSFGFPGHWLYEGDEPLVHLIPVRPGGVAAVAGGEGLDHIGFLRDDYDAFRGRLDAQGVAYSTMELPEIGERRLFLHAPGGALIEVAFRDRRPARTVPEALPGRLHVDASASVPSPRSIAIAGDGHDASS